MLGIRVIEHNIDIKWKEAKIVKRLTCRTEGIILESTEIIKQSKNDYVINTNDPSSLSNVWKWSVNNL